VSQESPSFLLLSPLLMILNKYQIYTGLLLSLPKSGIFHQRMI